MIPLPASWADDPLSPHAAPGADGLTWQSGVRITHYSSEAAMDYYETDWVKNKMGADASRPIGISRTMPSEGKVRPGAVRTDVVVFFTRDGTRHTAYFSVYDS